MRRCRNCMRRSTGGTIGGADFQRVADETTKGVLGHYGKNIPDMPAAVKIAVHYLLSEIAFCEFAPQFLGVETVAYVYHHRWPVFEDYIAGKFDGVPKPYMQFILLENPDSGATAGTGMYSEEFE